MSAGDWTNWTTGNSSNYYAFTSSATDFTIPWEQQGSSATLTPSRPKKETALEWLDRRVDEIRVKL